MDRMLCCAPSRVNEFFMGYKLGWCPARAWMKGRCSDAERSLVEPGVKVTWYAIAQQGFHGPHRVRHTCCYGRRDGPPLCGRSSTLTSLRLQESHDLLQGPASREGISALQRTHRRTPSPPTGAGGEPHSALLRWIVSRASGVDSEHVRVVRIASTLSR